ncbi:hypothetical protein ZYGR_0BA00760 [Zygosaccharomyces rouxii]|uniref:Fatty acid hydroxylase domain-containing protein n=1 Tax=Zygosaccharomyces rouxii TaxID=4956 RepID=A0A1Q3AKJ4_ZYGRO|nr:hypothetical protein ZYGR_0BA00760 [Zygosaccharomyces rouxii]
MNTSTFDYVEFKGPYGFMHSPVPPVVNLQPRPNIFSSVSDGILALAAPVICYWTYSMMFHIIDVFELAERYRIHDTEEVKSRNRAGRVEVFCEVIFQHIVQTTAGLILMHFDAQPMTGFEQKAIWEWRRTLPAVIPDFAVYYFYTYGISALKELIGFFIIDTWQYFWHRAMHLNKELYRRYHSRHHRLYVPYAYGALYNAPVEGFLLDTLGTGVAMLVTQMTYREQVILFSFATLKTVDDHCGYAFPWDPFQIIFPNNSVYHDIHHQNFGIKTNFSQPFFTFWDSLFHTNFAGFEQYQNAQRRVTIDRYKAFLKERKELAKKGINTAYHPKRKQN